MDLSSVATAIAGQATAAQTSLESIIPAVAAVLLPLLVGLWVVKRGFRFFGR